MTSFFKAIFWRRSQIKSNIFFVLREKSFLYENKFAIRHIFEKYANPIFSLFSSTYANGIFDLPKTFSMKKLIYFGFFIQVALWEVENFIIFPSLHTFLHAISRRQLTFFP